MEKITVTELRSRLYEVVDRVIKTGIPQEIERNGHKVKIVLDDAPARKKPKKKSKLDNLVKHDVLLCDPDELIDLKVWEWDPDKNIDPPQ